VEEQHDTLTRLGRKADFENGESLKPILKHDPKTFRPQKNRWGNAAIGGNRYDTRPSPRRRVHLMPVTGIPLRQVFGLAGILLAPASQSIPAPVLFLERLFLLTAAGQFRINTGFPFKSDPRVRHRKVFPI
jgi:hypothetical protein